MRAEGGGRRAESTANPQPSLWVIVCAQETLCPLGGGRAGWGATEIRQKSNFPYDNPKGREAKGAVDARLSGTLSPLGGGREGWGANEKRQKSKLTRTAPVAAKLHDPLDTLHRVSANLRIRQPKGQNPIALQKQIPLPIASRVKEGMPFPINLHAQASLAAIEIQNIRTKRVLTPKVETCPMVAKVPPKQPLPRRHSLTKPSRPLHTLTRHHNILSDFHNPDFLNTTTPNAIFLS